MKDDPTSPDCCFAVLFPDDDCGEAWLDPPERADTRMLRYAASLAAEHPKVSLVIVSEFDVLPVYPKIKSFIEKDRLLVLLDLMHQGRCKKTLLDWGVKERRITYFTKSPDSRVISIYSSGSEVLQKYADGGATAMETLQKRLQEWLQRQLGEANGPVS